MTSKKLPKITVINTHCKKCKAETPHERNAEVIDIYVTEKSTLVGELHVGYDCYCKICGKKSVIARPVHDYRNALTRKKRQGDW